MSSDRSVRAGCLDSLLLSVSIFRYSWSVSSMASSICKELYWSPKTGASCIGVHWRKFVSASSVRLVRLIWMLCEMRGKWPHTCFLKSYFQELFKIACNTIVLFPLSFFIMHFIKVQVVSAIQLYWHGYWFENFPLHFIKEIRFPNGQ